MLLSVWKGLELRKRGTQASQGNRLGHPGGPGVCSVRACFARLLCPWDSAGKNTRAGRNSLLQGIFPTQGSNPPLRLLHWQAGSLPAALRVTSLFILALVIFLQNSERLMLF